MKTLIKLYIIIAFLLGIVSPAIAQKILSSENCYIVSFSGIYRSNIIESFNSNGYDDLYLIVSKKPKKINIDIVMSLLSKKEYSSLLNIMDTLKQDFNIYTLVNDTSNKKNDKVKKLLTNYNNYNTGYLFLLNATIKKYGSQVGYIIQRFTLKGKIWYSILNSQCDNFPYECRAIIKKIE